MSQSKKNLDIEVLRGIAVLFVAFDHRLWLLGETKTRILDPYFNFWGGVDLFFVISGFVIGKSLLEIRHRYPGFRDFSVAIVAFWIRRIGRIWPSAWVWMLVPLGMALLTRPGGPWGGLWPDLTSVFCIVAGVENIHTYLYEHGGALRSSFAYSPYWSLSLEEQFYLVLPLMLLFVRRRRVFGTLLALGVLIQIFLPREMWSFLYAIRSDALLLGVLIALSIENSRLRHRAAPVFLARHPGLRVACTGALLFLLSAMTGSHIVPFFLGMAGLFAALLVWIASYDKGYIFPDNKIKHAMVWIGSRSYAIYLTHMPAYFLVREMWMHIDPSETPLHGWRAGLLVAVALALVMIFSELNYRFLETPLRRKGVALAQKFIQTRRA